METHYFMFISQGFEQYVCVCEVNIQHVSVRSTESMALAQKMNREKTTASQFVRYNSLWSAYFEYVNQRGLKRENACNRLWADFKLVVVLRLIAENAWNGKQK